MSIPRFYRGFSEKIKPGVYFNQYLNTPRSPTDTPEIVHKIADNHFFNIFGIRARSQSIFCTRQLETAITYATPDGCVMLISVPEGDDYTLIYSESVSDFLQILTGIKNYSKIEIENWIDKMKYQSISDFSNLPADFNGEIMLISNRYTLSDYE